MSLSELNQARMRHVEDARASAIELTLSDHLTPRQVRDGLWAIELTCRTWERWIIDGDKNVSWHGPLDYLVDQAEAFRTIGTRTAGRLEASYMTFLDQISRSTRLVEIGGDL